MGLKPNALQNSGIKFEPTIASMASTGRLARACSRVWFTMVG